MTFTLTVYTKSHNYQNMHFLTIILYLGVLLLHIEILQRKKIKIVHTSFDLHYTLCSSRVSIPFQINKMHYIWGICVIVDIIDIWTLCLDYVYIYIYKFEAILHLNIFISIYHVLTTPPQIQIVTYHINISKKPCRT